MFFNFLNKIYQTLIPELINNLAEQKKIIHLIESNKNNENNNVLFIWTRTTKAYFNCMLTDKRFHNGKDKYKFRLKYRKFKNFDSQKQTKMLKITSLIWCIRDY